MKIILIAIGGAAGSVGRYLASVYVYRLFNINNAGFPWGTLAVNATGSLLIGFLWGLNEENLLSDNARTFLFVGLLGGFTTFSAFSLETMNLIRSGEIAYSIFNILLSNITGIALAFGGFFAAKLLLSSFK